MISVSVFLKGDAMSLYMQNAIQFLKEQKEQFAKNDQCRELPPHLIVENKSGPAAIVIAPSLDKDLALKAAAMCSIGFSPVSMTIAFDALMSNAEESDEKQDCIICHSIDKEGDMKMSVLPYTSVDSQVMWQEEHFFSPKDSDDESISGDIPAALLDVMRTSNEEFMQDVKKEFGKEGMSEEEQNFHCGRAIISLLIGMGFKIVDLFSYKHPEWTQAKDKGIALVKEMVAMKKIDPAYQQKLEETIASCIGKPAFLEKFEHYLTEAKCECPKGSSLIEFVENFQQTCMQPLALGNESAKKIFSKFDL